MPNTILKEVKGRTQEIAVNPEHPIELKIGYIGGGSRGWAHGLMKDFALCPWFGGEVRLYDLDYEAAQRNAAYGMMIQEHPDNRARWRYRAVKTLRAALKDADFVFLSIQPGPIEYMKYDLELPMKYGIYQPVGDTTGPGGIIRGLRSARDYREFAEGIAAHCPDAWVINFTNPMSVCTKTLYTVFPQVKAYGCCHEVFGTQGYLGRLYARATGRPQPTRGDVRVNVLGINHFTWINQAECNGVELLELARAETRRPGRMKHYTEADFEGMSVFHGKGRVTLELLKRFDVLPAAGDRHLAEFVPWFLTSEKSCYAWGFCLTPYAYRINRWRTAPRQLQRQLDGKEPIRLTGSGEEYINQMAALVGLTSFRTNVNLPNRGQMDGVPEGALVETNALFSCNRVEPVVSGGLPAAVNSLIEPHVVNHDLVINGSLGNDKDMAFRAFINDPLTQRLGMDDAWALFNRMVRATKLAF